MGSLYKLKVLIKNIPGIGLFVQKSMEKYRSIFPRKTLVIRKEAFKTYGIQTFQEFYHILNELGVKAWLCYGTLLGYVRSNSILPHDNDFDVGILYTDFTPQIKKALEKHGFILAHEYSVENGLKAFEQTYVKNNVNIDIFYHYTEEKRIWTHVFYRKPTIFYNDNEYSVRELDYPFGGLTEAEFYSVKVYIPSNYDEYLRMHYGDTYLIPNEYFDWRKGPKADSTLEGIIGYQKRDLL